MRHTVSEIKELFKNAQEAITAIGDETRQSIIVTLLEGTINGMRVGEITSKTHLSRPAVSHHLKILKDANIITIKKVGTMNFYCLNPYIQEIENIRDLCNIIIQMRKEMRR